MLRLKSLLGDLRSSLWFVPAMIVAGACVLAVSLIEVDARLVDRELLARFPRLFGAGAEGSRGMLSSIAGSMITVAGVTFSITIVALSLASSQYTSRILRNFMRDRANQSVLGVFLGIFTYCLIVLRTIRGGDEGVCVPSLAVVFGVILAVIGIGFLIFFIHHIAASIQASNIIASAADETIKAIDNLFPRVLGEESDAGEDDVNDHDLFSMSGGATVPSRATGYIQSLDHDALLAFTCERKVLIRMERGIGDFVVERGALVSVYPEGAADEDSVKKLNGFYAISRYRTIEQDASFGIRQIVDIALKALSPGVNDTTTAVTCVDYLSAINARLAGRRIESPLRYADGELRVIARGATFEKLLTESFDQIRRSAEGNVAIITRMLQALETVAAQTADGRRLRVIAQQISLLEALAEQSVKSEHDGAEIRARISWLRPRLGATEDRQTQT
jgi:uncharacterized membrane protein